MDMPLSVGVIGVGRMAQRAHIPSLLAEGCHIRAVADPRVRTARIVADHFRISGVYDDAEQMLAREDIEAVVAAVPDAYHRDLTIHALEQGVHVLLEKPLAVNREDGRAMVDAARKAGRVLLVAYQRRHDPAARLAKDLVDRWSQSGELGEMRRMIVASSGGNWRCDTTPLLTGGEPLDEGHRDLRFPDWLPPELHRAYYGINTTRTHGLDLARYFRPGPTALAAAHPWPSASATLLFDWGGIDAVFVQDWGKKDHKSRWDESLEVRYEGGWMRYRTPPFLLRNLPGSVEVYQAAEGVRRTLEAPFDWCFRRQVRHFVDCIRTGCRENPTPEEALANVVLAEDIVRGAMQMPAPMPIAAAAV